MVECLCIPEGYKARKRVRDVSCKCADVADSWIAEGELSPELRCEFILDCFMREYGLASPEAEELYERLYKRAKEKRMI